MQKDLTKNSVIPTMLRFALPMIAGNLLQQCYNIADTLIVGRFLGPDALAAVGSAFTLMTFLTSILLGLASGAGTVFSIKFGQKDFLALKEGIIASFILLSAITLLMNILVFLGMDWILNLLHVTGNIRVLMKEYLEIIFAGIAAVFLYNYFASLLRALGNSTAPLTFLAVSAILNIGLDLWFVMGLNRGVKGAAEATIIAQYISGIGLTLYTLLKFPRLKIKGARLRLSRIKEITGFSALTCIQQSVMNLGILAVQGLANSFGGTVMAAFAAAVKIDAFAYLPVQDFGNAFSTFTAQNYGAKQFDRIKKGIKAAGVISIIFGMAISVLVCVFAQPLMSLFIDASQTDIIQQGMRYLRIEGWFYFAIGVLFLLYGLFRALGKPGISVVLTVISLGSRVILAYALAPGFGTDGIWWSVPIGWLLADGLGTVFFLFKRKSLLNISEK